MTRVRQEWRIREWLLGKPKSTEKHGEQGQKSNKAIRKGSSKGGAYKGSKVKGGVDTSKDF